jgi:hypothetical protein
MRDDHGCHRCRIEAGRLHVLSHLADSWWTVGAKACVEQHDLAAAPDGRGVKGFANLSGPIPLAASAFLDVLDRDVLDVGGIDYALDLAFMQAKHLDIADLVFQAVGGALRVSRTDEGNRTFDPEDQAGAKSGEHEITPRDFKHVFLLGCLLGVRFHVALATMLPFDLRPNVAHCSDHGKVILIRA